MHKPGLSMPPHVEEKRQSLEEKQRALERSKHFSALVKAGAQVDRFEKILAPMEDVFIRVIEQEKS